MSKNQIADPEARSVRQGPLHATTNEHHDTAAAPNDNISGTTVEQPTAQLEIDDNSQAPDDVVYPKGLKVWLAIGAMYMAFFLNGLVGRRIRMPLNARLIHSRTLQLLLLQRQV